MYQLIDAISNNASNPKKFKTTRIIVDILAGDLLLTKLYLAISIILVL
tara:strand:- start:173 stop:316 length:144 start_codon:yes stop_codon:yes gene_type:complete